MGPLFWPNTRGKTCADHEVTDQTQPTNLGLATTWKWPLQESFADCRFPSTADFVGRPNIYYSDANTWTLGEQATW